MPAITVHRYATGVILPSTNGTQYVDGPLAIPSGPVTIPLPAALYGKTQDYVLFDYSNDGSFPDPSQLSNLGFDSSELPLSEAGLVYDDPANSQVILKLQSRQTNGTQYVDESLDIQSPTPVVMKRALASTPTTYILFDVAPGGTISPGTLANIQVQAPAGRSIDPTVSPNPWIEGDSITGYKIKIKLA